MIPSLTSSHLLGSRYLLDTRLAVGGSSHVYAATDTRLGRQVAVKVLTHPDRDPDQAARFAEESRILAALNHPHVVPLLDAGTDEDRSYLVMPLIEGETLAGPLRRGSLPPAATARVGAALADALAHIHARGVVHRDLKPANVLIGARGGVCLADFGIAQAWDGPAPTADGLVVGTAGYLAPEQAAGRGAGPASDVYSLGLILLEALTGHPEYTGPALERLASVIHRPPVIPDTLAPGWQELLGRMLQTDPDARPPARHLTDLIAAVLEPGLARSDRRYRTASESDRDACRSVERSRERNRRRHRKDGRELPVRDRLARDSRRGARR